MLHYSQSEASLFFWRTNHGAEVDLVIQKHGHIIGAYEIKAGSNIAGADLSGLRAFRQDHPDVPCAIVCSTEHAYTVDDVRILPWQHFLKDKLFT